MFKKICVLGEGAWGTAIANLLVDNGYDVNLWCHEEEVFNSIKNSHSNKYMPGLEISSKIIPFTSMQKALFEVDYVFEAIPVKFLRSVILQSKSFFNEKQIWIVLSKGIECETLMLPSQILDDVFQTSVKKAVVSGPSFAKDLINKDFTAVDLATSDENIKRDIKTILSNDYFRVFSCADIKGIQLCAALKNVVSLIIGIAEGSGYTDNAKAYLASVGLNEISLIAMKFDGNKEVAYGLAGVGDLILSAFGKSGRNFLIGKEIGRGNKLDLILKENKNLPEGINTIKSVYQMINKYNLDLPFFLNSYKVVFENFSFEKFISSI